MMCISPMSVPRPNGKGARDRVEVPCGKCVNCLSNKRADWSFRLGQELKHSDTAFFITLTYDENICSNDDRKETSGYTELNKRHVQLFLKRLRRKLDMRVTHIKGENEDNKLKYYIVGEYGSLTKRPHYHGIFFNLPSNCEAFIEDAWSKGFVSIGTVNGASIHYVTKYVINKYDDYEEKQKPFSVMSTKPPIGHRYIGLSGKYHKDTGRTYATLEDGIKQNLPRYFKSKIFDKDLLKIHGEEAMQLVQDKKAKEERDYLENGENPFIIEQLKKEQRTESIKKLSKKSKL